MNLTSDFRSHLQNELIRRCRSNPKYSLRAFAKYLKVEPSALSKILNGKRTLSESMLERFSKQLDLSYNEKKRFREIQKCGQSDFKVVPEVIVEMVSHWYYYAILELTYVKHFKADIHWISMVLGVGKTQIQIAVDRLIQFGMLEIKPDGSWKDTAPVMTTINGLATSGARREYQKQLLEKAIEALETIPISERDQTSMTFATDPALLPEVRKKILNFRRNLSRFINQNGVKKEVYQCVISVFPLSIASTFSKESKE